MKQITSKDNPHYKQLVNLARSSRARRELSKIVLEGAHLVSAYVERFGEDRVELFVKHSALSHPEVARLSAGKRAVVLLNDTLFDHASPVQSPLGILAIADCPQSPVPQKSADEFHVLLDGVQDPGNVGAILRSAAAAGAACAHLSSNCADVWSPKALRGGMGAQFVISIEQHDDLARASATLDMKLIVCVADAPLSLFDADLRGPVAFVIGGEGAGVSAAVREQAHQLLRIPMQRGIESLNAGAAASVMFYERWRQTCRA